MKTSSMYRSTLAVLAGLCACLIAGQSAFAQSVLWTGASDDNWSTFGNWSPSGPPAGSDVVFGDLDATGTSGPSGTVNNIVDANLTINRLSYTNLTTVGYHTTQIPPGVILTLTNSGNTIFVNQPGINVAAAQVYATILGAGTLNPSNTTGVLSIGQGSTSLNSSRRATLDLSGLDNFNATLGRIILGQSTVHSNRANATLLLAKTNVIDLAQTGTTPGLLLGDMASNNGNSQTVELGVTNVILSDSGMTVGGRKGNGYLQFNSSLVSAGQGTVLFRARNGVGRQSQWLLGDNSTQTSSSGSYCFGQADFSTYGSVDASVNTMILGRAGNTTIVTYTEGILTFDAGTVDVNNLTLGMQSATSAGQCRGTVNVNGTGQLIVNGNLTMGLYFGGALQSYGLLNIGTISGGAVTVKGDIISGGGADSKITSFGALTLGGKLGDLVDATNTPLPTLELGSGSVTFARGSAGLPATPLVQVTNLNVNGSISVSVSGQGFVPGQFPLFQYYSGLGDVGGSSGFGGLVLALPSYLQGYLSNHTANASVDLVITNVTTKKWSGIINGDWNINTTVNWTNTPGGASSVYFESSIPGDAVVFDDSAAGTTTVNLTTNLSPAGILVSNLTKTYTFNGTGALSGPTGIIKQDAGTLILANSGTNDFTDPVVIEGGTVQLSGSDDRLPTSGSVTLADVAGAALDLNGLNQTIAALNGGGATGGEVSLGAGNLTVNGIGSFAGVISGSGIVTKSGSGTLTLSGNNTHSGGTILSGGGVLALANSNAAGTGTITLASTQTGTSVTVGLYDGINVTNDIQIDVSTGRETINSYITNNTLSGNVTINNDAAYIIMFNNNAPAGTTFTVGGATPNSTTITAPTFANAISFRANTNGALGTLNSQINAPNAQFNGNNNGLWTINSTGNTWVATTFSTAAKFVLGASDALATGAHLSFASSATGYLDLNGKNQTVAGLDVGKIGTIQIKNTGASDSILTLSGLTTNRNFNGIIADGGAGQRISLVLNDSSGFTQTLSGANTYTGNTTVSNGTLAIQVASIATNSTVSVAAGAVLQLNFAETNIVAAFVTNGVSLPAGVYSAGNVGPLLAGAGSLEVVSSGPSGPATLTNSYSGGVLTLTWPAGEGWRLVNQTNSLSTGLNPNTNAWFTVPGGVDGSNSITVSPNQPTVFFRLVAP